MDRLTGRTNKNTAYTPKTVPRWILVERLAAYEDAAPLEAVQKWEKAAEEGRLAIADRPFLDVERSED